ncbi:hypothetical protein C8J57DRAFT_1244964 [Mycena rebaudengoi]|nr:hypothetical protein C8J57DRAFT_1244964 [Mycena rebaudengoi]
MADKEYPADRSVNRRRINGSTGHFFFPNRNFTNWRLLRNSYHMSPDFSANDGVKFFLQGSGLKDTVYTLIPCLGIFRRVPLGFNHTRYAFATLRQQRRFRQMRVLKPGVHYT